jgi:predicted MPP superfamily phosphohydrolase
MTDGAFSVAPSMKRIRALALNRRESFRAVAGASVWVGLYVYAGRPLLVAAHAEGIAPLIAWSALMAMAAISILPLFARRPITYWTGYALMSLFSLLLMLVAFSDLFRLVWHLARLAIALPILDVRMMSFAILGTAGTLAVVGLAQARCPAVRRVEITIDRLPAELDGYRIVQWSDVHVGPTIRRDFVARLVERTNVLHADAIAITGDLFDGAFASFRDDLAPMRNLIAGDGIFYVTGNHEYYWRASEWIPFIERLGITFLKNEHRVVRPGLVIAGVTDPAGRNTDAKAALAGAPRGAVTVMLAHRPQLASRAADLQLSGHTHGGQFFPFNLIIRWFQPVVAGLHRAGKTWLYVSRGTGYWGPPSRLGVGGEITLIELRNGQTARTGPK